MSELPFNPYTEDKGQLFKLVKPERQQHETEEGRVITEKIPNGEVRLEKRLNRLDEVLKVQKDSSDNVVFSMHQLWALARLAKENPELVKNWEEKNQMRLEDLFESGSFDAEVLVGGKSTSTEIHSAMPGELKPLRLSAKVWNDDRLLETEYHFGDGVFKFGREVSSDGFGKQRFVLSADAVQTAKDKWNSQPAS